MNGPVERCNGARRYEFYETYDLPSGVNQLNPILESYQHLYNHHRPHGALAEEPQPSISLANQPGHPRRPICPEPGHRVDANRQEADSRDDALIRAEFGDVRPRKHETRLVRLAGVPANRGSS
jgi:hypothetical protein